MPTEEQKGENGDKHVNFVDEAASRKLIAQRKAVMRSESLTIVFCMDRFLISSITEPKAPNADKAEARDFLEFHGEIGV